MGGGGGGGGGVGGGLGGAFYSLSCKQTHSTTDVGSGICIFYKPTDMDQDHKIS